MRFQNSKMKYRTKLALRIFTIGTVILSIVMYAVYRYNYKTTIQKELHYTSLAADEIARSVEQRLLEKVKTNQTLSIAPIIINTLKTSNHTYGSLSKKERNEKIDLQNKKWKSNKVENDAFIHEFTHNIVAKFLKKQQNNLKGEYGEIFITNKYGTLVASTAKLTTFAHAHKYWWQGAFNKGLGTVFIDDRGFDESANGYVLGIVIPIKEDNEIIGILKVNLNILSTISEILLSSQNEKTGDFKLIRSKGEIVFEEGHIPLSTRIPNLYFEELLSADKHSIFFDDSVNKWLIGKAEIGITSQYSEDYLFGGSFESIDHKKGNAGESWYIINYRNLLTVLEPNRDKLLTILITGFLLIIILAFASFAFGKLAAKPLNQLIDQSKKIATTDFSTRIAITRKDEFGLLGKAFNEMAEELEKNTTSIKNLEDEIAKREKSDKTIIQNNKELQNLIATKDKFFSIIAHDLRGPLGAMFGLSEILYNDFDEYETEKQKEFTRAIHIGIKNTYELLENLLIWSRSHQGYISFNPDKTSLYLLVNETSELLNQSSREKDIKISNKIPKDMFVYADKQMSLAIIRNLISNAIKFTTKGGDITIKAHITPTIDNQNYSEISIKDNGIGISKEIQPKLFNITEDISTLGTESETGTGLGLILCKEFVESQGGKIWIESEEGKGSDFIFTLPLNKSL